MRRMPGVRMIDRTGRDPDEVAIDIVELLN
jgi:hypothetical protein